MPFQARDVLEFAEKDGRALVEVRQAIGISIGRAGFFASRARRTSATAAATFREFSALSSIDSPLKWSTPSLTEGAMARYVSAEMRASPDTSK